MVLLDGTSVFHLVQDNLTQLFELISSANDDDSTINETSFSIDAKAVVKDIFHCFEYDCTEEKERDAVLSLLLNSEGGLIKFCNDSVSLPEYEGARTEILLFFAMLYSSGSAYSSKITMAQDERIKDVCRLIFTFEKGSAVKKASIDVLDSMFKARSGKEGFEETIKVSELYEKFFKEYLQQLSSLRPLVKGSLLSLLGSIAGEYPNAVSASRSVQQLRIYVETMNFEVFLTKKKTELNILAGCFNGLCSFLKSFTKLLEDDKEAVKKVYEACKAVMCPPPELTRYDACRSALQLFELQNSLFAPYFLDDYRRIFNILNETISHKNIDMQKLGRRALESFFKQVPVSVEKASQTLQAIWFFINYFNDCLHGDWVDVKKLAMSIRGYGYFARTSSSFMKQAEIAALLHDLFEGCGWLFSDLNQNVGESLVYLPSVASALTSIGYSLESLTPEFISQAEEVQSIFFLHFVHFSKWSLDDMVRSLLGFYWLLYQKGELKMFISRVFTRSIILTCSDACLSTLPDFVYDPSEHAYFEYLHFWLNIFNEFYFPKEEKSTPEFFQIIFDQIINSSLIIMESLNLSVQSKEDPKGSVTNLSNVHNSVAVKPKDYDCFVNLIDFLLIFLEKTSSKGNFVPWVSLFGKRLILLSLKLPYVSGFYKLLGKTLQLAKKCNMDLDNEKLKNTFSLFSEQVMLQIPHLKDDLLASCVDVVLNASTLNLVPMNNFKSALEIALRLGATYKPLALLGVESLSVALSTRRDDIRFMFPDILPLLSEYISMGNNINEADVPNQKISTKLSKKKLKYRPISSQDQADYDKIRIKVLEILGGLCGESQFILKNEITDVGEQSIFMEDENSCLAWDPVKRIKFRLPVIGVHWDLFLDQFLPRVRFLAVSSAQRKVKVAASELLHAMLTLMIGNYISQSSNLSKDEQAKGPFYKLFEKVFPALLKLAVDVEVVTRQLFHPLVFQLIHLFTKNVEYENPEAMLFLNVCFEAVCHPQDPVLSEFGAECLEEFLKYSMKQYASMLLNSKNASARSSLNVKSFWKRIYILLTHPSETRRKGAAVIFNRIYRVFREDENLVDEYLFEFMEKLFYSLKLSSERKDKFKDTETSGKVKCYFGIDLTLLHNLGLFDQLECGLRHCCRIISVRKDLFITATERRRKFSGLKAQDIIGLCLWLLDHSCDRDSLSFGELCRNSFNLLFPLIGEHNVENWFGKNGIEDRLGHLLSIPSPIHDKFLILPYFVWLIESKFVISVEEQCKVISNSPVKDLFSNLSLQPPAYLIQVLRFINCIVREGGFQQFCKAEKLDSELYSFITDLLIDPTAFGFDMEREELKASTPRKTSLHSVCSSLLENFKSPGSRNLYGLKAFYNWENLSASLHSISASKRFHLKIFSLLLKLDFTSIESPEAVIAFIADNSVRADDVETKIMCDSVIENVIPYSNSVLIAFCNELACCKKFRDEKRLASFISRNETSLFSCVDQNLNVFLKSLFDRVDFRNSNLMVKTLSRHFGHQKMQYSSIFLALACKFNLFKEIVLREVDAGLDMFLNLFVVQQVSQIPDLSQGLLVDLYKEGLTPDSSWALKIKALKMMPYLLNHLENKSKIIVRDAFKSFSIYQLPFSSKGISKNGNQLEVYLNAVESILACLGACKDAEFFKLMIPILCREQDHPLRDKMDVSLQVFSGGVESTVLKICSTECYSVLFDDAHEIELRENVSTLVLLPFLRKMPIAHFIDVTSHEFNRLIDTISAPLDPKLGSQDANEVVRLKSICYCHITLIYERIKSDILNGTVPLFNGKIKGKKGNEISKELIKVCVSAKNTKIQVSGIDKEVARTFHSCALRCLIAIFCCTQSKVKVFDSFLFSAQKDFFWANVINLDDNPFFPIELKYDPSLSKFKGRNYKAQNMKLLSSEYFTESSFSQAFAGWSSTLTQPANVAPEVSAEGGSLEESPSSLTVQLEEDAVNRIPLMASLVKCVEKIVSLMTPEEKQQRPCSFENSLLMVFNSISTPKMVKLFISKILINCSNFMEWDGQSWMAPMMVFVMENSTFSISSTSDGINTYLQDCLILFVSWLQKLQDLKTISGWVQSNISVVNRFLDFVIVRCPYERKVVVQNSLLILSSLIDLVGMFATPNPDLILGMIRSAQEYKVFAGLHISGLFISKGIHFFKDYSHFDLLMEKLNEKNRLLAAEVLGMLFGFYSSQKEYKSTHYVRLRDLLNEKISDYNPMTSMKNEVDKFLVLLNKVGRFDKSLILPYQNQILYVLPKLHGKLRVIAYECLEYNASTQPQLITDLFAKGFVEALKHRDEGVQTVCLNILLSLSKHLEGKDWKVIIPVLNDSLTNFGGKAQKILLYQVFNAALESMKGSLPNLSKNPLLRQVISILLRGLLDDEMEIRDLVYQFLVDQGVLNENEPNNFVPAILQSLYSVNVETSFLELFCCLSHRLMKKCPDYESVMFEDGIPNASFQEISITTDIYHASAMTPLFVNSQMTNQMGTQDGFQAASDNMVLATQSQLLFSQTQASSSFSQNHFPGGGRVSIGSQAVAHESIPIGALKKRFISDPDSDPSKSQSEHFKKLADKQRKMADKLRRKRNLEKYNKVKIMRHYRSGELPDIEIKVKDIMIPLITLCEMDPDISSIFFTDSLRAVISNSQNVEETSDRVQTALIDILKESSVNYPPLMASLMKLYQESFSSFDSENIWFDPKLLSTIAVRSKLEHLGVLCLEEALLTSSSKSSNKKRKTSQVEGEIPFAQESWLEIAKLYQEINERDICSGIYLFNGSFSKDTTDALSLELGGETESALNIYIKQRNEKFGGLVDEEIDLLDERIISCYEKLGEWDVLASSILISTEGNVDKVWNDGYRDMFLSRFIKSLVCLESAGGITPELHVHSYLTDTNGENPLYRFVKDAMKDGNRRNYLIRNFSVELGLLSAINGDLNQSSYYLQESYDNFCSKWTVTHPLAYSQKKEMLFQLSKSSHLSDLIRASRNTQPAQNFGAINLPSKTYDSLSNWIELYYYRKPLFKSIDCKSGEDNYMKNLCELSLNLGNLVVSRFALSKNFGNSKSCEFTLKALEAGSDFSRLINLYGNCRSNDDPELVPILCRILEGLNQYLPVTLINEACSDASRIFQKPLKDKTQIRSLFLQEEYKLLCNAVSTSSREKRTESFLAKLFEFSVKSLPLIRSPDELVQGLSFVSLKVIDYLNGLEESQYDGGEVARLFLQLLNLFQEFPQLSNQLSGICDRIPARLAAKWVSQITATYSTSCFASLKPLLLKIAEKYPQALFFALNVSKTQAENSGIDSITEENKSLADHLLSVTNHPILERYVYELEQLNHPELEMKYKAGRVINLLSSNRVNAAIAEATQLEEIVQKARDKADDSRAKIFYAKYGTAIKGLFGNGGSKLKSSSDSKKLSSQLSKLMEQITSEKNKKSDVGLDLLQKYSPWLANFQALDHQYRIVMPGEIDPEIYVSSFDSRILVLSSLRKPKRIKIFGSDQMERYILVKHGEDLRLDHRVQQTFGVMNDLIRKTVKGRENSTFAFVDTYKVIPLNFQLGLIEWVDNTKPLLGCLKDSLARAKNATEIQVHNDLSKAQVTFGNWYNRNGTVAKDASDSDCIKMMDTLHSLFPWDLLRKYILSLCSSPETFFSMRGQLASSLAAMNVFHYLLGIGDRHLENFLLNSSTGRIMGIDFGHALGSATIHLGIPEVVPYRWTRQLEGIFTPLGKDIIIRPIMINVLKTLVKEKGFLLDILEVFVKEPLLDWQRFAQPDADDDSNENSSSMKVAEWYPQERLNSVERKLNLESPVSIICSELDKGHGGKPFLASLKKALGKCQKSTLESGTDEKKRIETCVDELQSISTNPIVLAHAYAGWQPWL